MSVIIKSNNVASNSLGTVKMLGTTAQAEFDKYKARVVADGGVIKDELRTKRAFKMLFDTRMYGNTNSFVSGSFGAKINSVGGITKLYAIDGVDLIGKVYGTGALPTLGAGDSISFASNSTSDDINGGMFSTEAQKVMSKNGSFGYAVRFYSSGGVAGDYAPIAELSKHNDTINTAAIAQLYLSKATSNIDYSLAKNPLNLTAVTASELLRVGFSGFSLPFLSFLSQPTLPYKVGARNGVETVSLTTDKPFAEIKSETFYLDFGGVHKSSGKKFAVASIVDFICFNQATREQAAAISGFSA